MRKRFIAAIMLITLVSTSVEALAQSKVAVNSTAVTQGLKDMMSPSGKFLKVEMADGTSFSTAPISGGDVVGPASSENNRVVFFDGLSGKLIKDSGILLSGSNTGDNATNSQYSSLVSNATHTGDVLGGTSTTVVGVNGTLMSGLATGIIKNTTTTGVPSIAVAGDFPTLNQDTTGTAANVAGIVAVENGGHGTNTAAGARVNLGAAMSGANTDITSLSSPVLGVPEVLGGITTAAGDGQTFEIGGYINSPFLQVGEYQNYLLYSESFAQSTWVKTLIGTVTANGAISPLGTTVAENIPAGSGSTASLSQAITNSSTGNWTFSVWLKAQSGTAAIALRIDSSAEVGIEKSIALTTTWRRYFVTQNFVSENTTKTVYVVSGTNAIAVWGAQLEPLAYPRRYNGYDTINAITALNRGIYSPILITAGAGIIATNSSITTRNSIATTSTEGILNQNTTAATSGVPVQMSPRLRFSGAAWDTGSLSSKTVNGIIEILPISGNPTSANMDFSIDPGTGVFTKYFSITPSGVAVQQLKVATGRPLIQSITSGRRKFIENSDGLGSSAWAYNTPQQSSETTGTRTSDTVFTRTSGTWTASALVGQYAFSFASGVPTTGIWLPITANGTDTITITGTLNATGTSVYTCPFNPIKATYAHGQGANAFFGGVFDGESIWLVPLASSNLVKVNPATGAMTTYAHGQGASAFIGGVFDGESIWLVPYASSNLVKVNPATGAMTTYAHGQGASAFYGGVFDGESIWLVPLASSNLVKVNPATGAMTTYAHGQGISAFAGGVFDGESIWLIPYSSSNLVKVNVVRNGYKTSLKSSLTTLTYVAPGTPDYAIATMQLAGYGFSTADEGNTVLSVIENLQKRILDLELRVMK